MTSKVLELVIVPVQKQVEVGALAIQEPPDTYPDLYQKLKDSVDPLCLHEFVYVTWIHDDKWHGQPDGFYHFARFKPSKVIMFN